MRFSRANVLMSESCSGTHVWSTRKVIQKWGWGLTQPCWVETSGNTLVFQSPFRNSCGRLCREDRWRELPSAVCCRLRRRSNPAGGPGGSTWSTEELAMNGFIATVTIQFTNHDGLEQTSSHFRGYFINIYYIDMIYLYIYIIFICVCVGMVYYWVFHINY